MSNGSKSSRIIRLHQQSENGPVSTSVTQVIIPVMENGIFRGAYEIDRDYTAHQDRLRTIKLLAAGMLLLASGGALFFLWQIVKKASFAEKELRRAHDQLNTAFDAIKKAIREFIG